MPACWSTRTGSPYKTQEPMKKKNFSGQENIDRLTKSVIQVELHSFTNGLATCWSSRKRLEGDIIAADASWVWSGPIDEVACVCWGLGGWAIRCPKRPDPVERPKPAEPSQADTHARARPDTPNSNGWVATDAGSLTSAITGSAITTPDGHSTRATVLGCTAW